MFLDIRHLTLTQVWFNPSLPSTPTLNFPFCLSHLSIRPPPPHMFPVFQALTDTPHLTSLEIDISESSHLSFQFHQLILEEMEVLAPRLIKLGFKYDPDPSIGPQLEIERLRTVLGKCTKLKVLSTTEAGYPGLVAMLPRERSARVTWVLGQMGDKMVWDQLELALPTLETSILSKIQVNVADQENRKSNVAKEFVHRLCAQRSIQLVEVSISDNVG